MPTVGPRRLGNGRAGFGIESGTRHEEVVARDDHVLTDVGVSPVDRGS